MNTLSISLLIITFNINFSKANNIIQIPKGKKICNNISTRYGYINYSFFTDCQATYIHYVPYSYYTLEGIKNLTLVNLSNFHNANLFYEIYDKENLGMKFLFSESDSFNDVLCEIFYNTSYIDKLIYSFGKNEKNELTKFYGGIPQKLTKNLNKFSFKRKTERLSEIKLELNNGINLDIIDIDEDFFF